MRLGPVRSEPEPTDHFASSELLALIRAWSCRVLAMAELQALSQAKHCYSIIFGPWSWLISSHTKSEKDTSKLQKVVFFFLSTIATKYCIYTQTNEHSACTSIIFLLTDQWSMPTFSGGDSNNLLVLVNTLHTSLNCNSCLLLQFSLNCKNI